MAGVKNQVFEVIIVREEDDEMKVEYGPEVVCAPDAEAAKVEAVIDAGLSDSTGVKVLVRPFLKNQLVAG